MPLHYINKHNALRILSWVAISTCYLLLTAMSNSPLYDYLGSDSVLYRLVGQAWLRGDVPYSAIFDNKGPYLYLIEMVGALISPNRWGILLLEIVNLSICLEILYRIARLFTKTKWKIALSLSTYLIFLGLCIDGGNLTEEWSQIFVLLPSYLCLKYLLTGSQTHPLKYTLLYGACFGILAFIRINNAAIIVGIVLGLTALLIYKRQFASLGQNALSFIIGILVTISPVLIYFGIYGDFDEMMYDNFWYNIKYKEEWKSILMYPWHERLKLCLPCLIAIGISLVYDKKVHTSTAYYIVPSCAVTFATFIDGNGFPHYYMMVAPFTLFIALQALSLPKAWSIIALIILFFNTAYYTNAQRFVEKIDRHFIRSIDEFPSRNHHYEQLATTIPPAERDSVAAFDISLVQNDIFLDWGRTPVFKYTYMHTEVATIDNKVHDEIHQYMKTQRPLWLVVSATIDNPLFDSIKPYYKREAHSFVMDLYRRRN